MNADLTWAQPLKDNEKNGPVEEGKKASSEVDPVPRELTPDRPPQLLDAGQAGETSPKRARGFAAMDRKLVSEIARKGGRAAHTVGTAHEFTSEEARLAGRKGGQATHAKRRKATDS